MSWRDSHTSACDSQSLFCLLAKTPGRSNWKLKLECLFAMEGCNQRANYGVFWWSINTVSPWMNHWPCTVCFAGALGGSSKDKRVSCRTPTPLRVLSAGGSRGVMRSGMFSSSVAAVQGMMAWQTRSQMAHLGIPAAARWHDTRITAEILSSRASARTFRQVHPPSPRPPVTSLLPPRPSPQRWLCERCHIDYGRAEMNMLFFFLKLCFPVSWV